MCSDALTIPAREPLLEQALASLAAVVGEAHVLRAAQDVEAYAVDERRLYHGRPLAVVRPADRAELVAVMRACHAARLPMVPQGGNTGYCGGATPDASGREVVISLQRLNRIIAVDHANATLTLEAGVVLAAAQSAAHEQDLLLPLSMGSEGSCQIGGNLSTNAGGLAVLRYGCARELVLGLEVVLADGRCLSELAGLRKDNTGYDLKQLFIGAEGTLGIISAATFKLFPRPPVVHTAFVALRDLAAACELLAVVRGAVGDNVTSFEYLGDYALRLVLAAAPELAVPLGGEHRHYALVEWACYDAAGLAADAAEAVLGPALAGGLVVDAAIAHNETQRRAMWRLRESVPAAEKRLGGSIKHDVAVRLGDVAGYVDRVRSRLLERWPEVGLSIYGHVGDGNVHFNVLAPDGSDPQRFKQRHATAISDVVHETALALGGSFSAEHGVGVLKRDLLARYASAAELEIMRGIKSVLDPLGLMNPGKLL